MSMDDHEWEKIKIPKVNTAKGQVRTFKFKSSQKAQLLKFPCFWLWIKEKFDSGITKTWEWREKQLLGLRKFLDDEKEAIFKGWH